MSHEWKLNTSSDGMVTRDYWDCGKCGRSIRWNVSGSPPENLKLIPSSPVTSNYNVYTCEELVILRIQEQ